MRQVRSKHLSLISTLLIFFSLMSCSEESALLSTVTVSDQFTIDVPPYLTEMNLENPDACLQYGNDLESHYLVVIRETHQKLERMGIQMGIDEYAELMIRYAQASIANAEIDPLTEGIEEVNGMEAKGYQIQGENHEGLPIFYHIMYLRSEKAFYSVTTWCTQTNKDKCQPYMAEMVRSLKEI